MNTNTQTSKSGRLDQKLCCKEPESEKLVAPAEARCRGNGSEKKTVFRQPGPQYCHFVEGLFGNPEKPVPRISSKLVPADFLGALRVRLGIRRNDYRVNPGLYAVGTPDQRSPVLVTANYKLSFDHVRSQMQHINAWLLVLDTFGVNVWCAAGKKTFSSEELINRIDACELKNMVSHRSLILPQLGASGVSSWEVREKSGFSVLWGPIRAVDIPKFLENDCLAEEKMRMVTFSLIERLQLIPVEVSNILKSSCFILAGIFLFSGVGREVFSFSAVGTRGGSAAIAYFLGILGGTVVVPVLLPWIPGRRFYFKGLVAGFPLAVFAGWLGYPVLRPGEIAALILLCLSVSSFTAMNFTGSTPFTSPSGVQTEVRRGLWVQSLLIVFAIFLWFFAAFSS